MKMTKDQKDLFNKVHEIIDSNIKLDIKNPMDRMISIHGPAGVGKSFVTSEIIKSLDKKYNVRMTTPTHKSLEVIRNMLKNINCEIENSTIHSFLKLKLQPDYNTGLMALLTDNTNKDKSKLDVLIIDESSMISSELFKFIVDSLKSRRVKFVIFVGDKLQLPPPDEDVNEDGTYISPLEEVTHKLELTKVVRQAKENPVLSLVTDIREHLESSNFVNIEHFFKERENIHLYKDPKEFVLSYNNNPNDSITVAFTNEKVDQYNYILRKYDFDKRGLDSEPFITEGEELVLQGAYGKGKTNSFRNGEHIIVYDVLKIASDDLPGVEFWRCKDSQNRTIDILDDESFALFDGFLKELAKLAKKATPSTRGMYWKEYFELKGQFATVKHKYAHTIHKSQGSTYQSVYLDARELRDAHYLEREFLYRLLYVALSRASEEIHILY